MSNSNEVNTGIVEFDVEHMLSLYALGYCTLDAKLIYEESAIGAMADHINRSHIYLIGEIPIAEQTNASFNQNVLTLNFKFREQEHKLDWQVPDGSTLREENDRCFIESPDGKHYWPDSLSITTRLSWAADGYPFKVKYIGQAYGKNGSRNAIDRLLKHETLQKISLKGTPDGYKLQLILLELEKKNRIMTTFNPDGQNKDDGSRIQSGLDKLFDTTHAEQISIFEAAFIRYFYPDYNKEFKDSFPSTKLKILQDCYKKDFQQVAAEICIDNLPFQLYSDSVEPLHEHIALFDLHKDSNRRAFFSMPRNKDKE